MPSDEPRRCLSRLACVRKGGRDREVDGLALAIVHLLFPNQRQLRSGIEAEDAQFLRAAAGFGEAGGPGDGLVAGG